MPDLSQLMTPHVISLIKILMYSFVGIIFFVITIYLIIWARRRKWYIEIHEQKADGRIHTIGFDVLYEKKIKLGSRTIYWLKKAKQQTIPPPSDCVDRFRKGARFKEEVDYLRIDRDFVPVIKKIETNYKNPEIKNVVIKAYDKIIADINNIKTTLFHTDAVRERYIYIPINKTLTANMKYSPIDYDMNMMAMNEIHMADEFFQSKYEWWRKYGGVIVFAVTIIFLIIIAVLTYNYLTDIANTTLGKVEGMTTTLKDIVGKMGGGTPPS